MIKSERKCAGARNRKKKQVLLIRGSTSHGSCGSVLIGFTFAAAVTGRRLGRPGCDLSCSLRNSGSDVPAHRVPALRGRMSGGNEESRSCSEEHGFKGVAAVFWAVYVPRPSPFVTNRGDVAGTVSENVVCGWLVVRAGGEKVEPHAEPQAAGRLLCVLDVTSTVSFCGGYLRLQQREYCRRFTERRGALKEYVVTPRQVWVPLLSEL